MEGRQEQIFKRIDAKRKRNGKRKAERAERELKKKKVRFGMEN
jgi:hypothetical protein